MSTLLHAASYLQVLLLLWCVTYAFEVDPIVIKGSHFFYDTTGSEFFIRGITYQAYTVQSFSMDRASTTLMVDPLTDDDACLSQIALLQELNINLIRIYYLDAKADHSGCMTLLQDAGIYIYPELTSSHVSIDDNNPIWDRTTFTQFTGVVDNLAKFSNVLGFGVGIFSASDSTNFSLPFFKAAIRDMKAHIKEKQYRNIPVGLTSYAPFGEDDNVAGQLDFLTCDETPADFLGIFAMDLNCTSEDDIKSYAKIYRHATIPVFMDSYGCLPDTDNPDSFEQSLSYDSVRVLYSDEISPIFSGGIVYGKFFGTSSSGSSNWNKAFPAISSAMASVHPSSTSAAEYIPTASPPSCPTGPAWTVSSILPPKPNTLLCSCMVDTLHCVAKDGAVEKKDDTEIAEDVRSMCEGNEDCVGVRTYTTGRFGAFTVCNGTERWSWAANQYWKRHGDEACNMNGTAILRGERPPPSQECAFLLQQAGDKGEKTVTVAALPAATSFATSPYDGSPVADRDSNSGGLSSGALAGIAISVISFVIAIALAVWFTLRHRKRNKDAITAIRAKRVLFPRPLGGRAAYTDQPELVQILYPHTEISLGPAISPAAGVYKHRVSEMAERQSLVVEAPVAPGKNPAVNQSPVELPEFYFATELAEANRLQGQSRTNGNGSKCEDEEQQPQEESKSGDEEHQPQDELKSKSGHDRSKNASEYHEKNSTVPE